MAASAHGLAISTAWNAARHNALAPVLAEIGATGLRAVELSYLTPDMAASAAAALETAGLSVQSVHAPYPWPVGNRGERLSIEGLDDLASPDSARRAAALRMQRETIAASAAIGARAVVLHLGHIEGVRVRQETLLGLLRAGRRDELAELRGQALAEREERRGPYLRAALESIGELGRVAADAGVELGIETRDQFHEIPNLAEFEDVFAVAEGLPVGCWHDIGHIEKQQALGLASHLELARRYGSKLLGVHLHDVRSLEDHFAPGTGDVDWAALAPIVPRRALRTLELHNKGGTQDLTVARAAIALLRRHGLG